MLSVAVADDCLEWLVGQEREQAVSHKMVIRNLTDQMFQGSTLAACLVDLGGTILQVNPAFEALTGRAAQEVLSKACHQVIPDASCRSNRCPLHRLRMGETVPAWKRTLRRANGQCVTCRATAIPIRDQSESLVGAFECLEVVQPASFPREEVAQRGSPDSALGGLVATLDRLHGSPASLGDKLHRLAEAMLASTPGSYCQIWVREVAPPTALTGRDGMMPALSGAPSSGEDASPHGSMYLAAAAGHHPLEAGDPWIVPIPPAMTPTGPSVSLGEFQIYGSGDLRQEFTPLVQLLARWTAQLLSSSQTEHALQSRIRLFENILAALPIPVYWKNLDCTYAGCNEALLSVCGLSASNEIVGRTGEELGLTLDSSTPLAACDELVLAGGERATNIEQPVMMPDGTEAVYLTSKTPLQEADGRIIGLVGTAVDVTAQRRASEDLARVQAALDDATEAVLFTDGGGRVTYLNLATGRLLGHTLESLNAEGLAAIFASPDTLEHLKKALGALEKWEEEVELRPREGRAFPAQVRAAPLVSDDIRVCGMLLTITDLTDSRALQQQLMQAQKMESVGQLAAGIAHEINTPSQYVSDNVHFLKDAMEDIHGLLGALRTLAREGFHESWAEANPAASNNEPIQRIEDFQARIEAMLQDADIEFLEEEIPAALDQAMEGLQRIGTIVHAMKEFSHPGTKKKQAIDLNEAIRSTITVTTHHWKYLARLETDLDPDLPPVPCLPGELNQAVLNLIVNAADAIGEARAETPDELGLIRVSTRVEGSWVEIRVADDGGGIPAEVQERIFEPFFTTKEVGKGSGQGLAIAYTAIVDKHGGVLTFETIPGEGTSFVIRLPTIPNEGKATAA